jgi:hypothetical protein
LVKFKAGSNFNSTDFIGNCVMYTKRIPRIEI